MTFTHRFKILSDNHIHHSDFNETQETSTVCLQLIEQIGQIGPFLVALIQGSWGGVLSPILDYPPL